MIFRQLFDAESCTYSYLIADGNGGEAILIDPVIDKVPQYLQLLKELDVRLAISVDTHTHADHVTGMGLLREQVNCQTMIGEQARAECVSASLTDGQRLRIGPLTLQSIYTPGHTDDSYSFLLNDDDVGRLFTGDTLLIHGTGRTDFQNGDAGEQYDSLFKRLLTLPEQTLVYPGHDYNGLTVSTIGEEKRFNPRLQVRSKEQYIAQMNALNLPNPKLMDIAVPANRACGNAA